MSRVKLFSDLLGKPLSALAGLNSSTSPWSRNDQLQKLSHAAARSMATRSEGVDATLPNRVGLFRDTVLVHGLLPNRREFTAQFTPHGIMLVPKAILQQVRPVVVNNHSQPSKPPAHPVVAVDAAKPHTAESIMRELASIRAHVRAAAMKLSSLEEYVDDEGYDKSDNLPVMEMATDRTRDWRKSKIKKHKIKKRRRANRHKAT